MDHKKLLDLIKIFSKNRLGGCKSQIFVIGDKNAGRGERVAARRFGDDFDWKGGHSANLEAPWVI